MENILSNQNIINPLNTIEFETHITNFLNLSENMKEYIDGYIFSRPHNIRLKGLFLEYEIPDDGCKSYHGSKVMIEKNGQLMLGYYSFIFQEEYSGNSYKQKAGSKNGILFIPLDINASDKIRVRLTLSEYADPDLLTLLDETTSMLELEDFKSFYYVDFASETPQILIGALQGDRPTGGEIPIIFNNTNFFFQTTLLKVLKDDEKDSDREYHIVDTRVRNIKLEEPGIYRIIACVCNIPREHFNPLHPEYNLITKEERIITVYKPCDIKIEHDKFIRKGQDIKINISANTPCDVKRCYLGIKKYEEDVSLKFDKKTKKENPISYTAVETFSTEYLPSGLHVITVKFILTDGSKEMRTSTFVVTDGEDTDLQYFE